MENLIHLLAEVMDKEPSLVALWTRGLVIGLVGLLASRWRRWAAWPPLLVALLFSYAILSELFDPFVGPAIRLEAGLGYFAGAMAAGLVSIALTALGLLTGRRRGSSQEEDVPRDT